MKTVSKTQQARLDAGFRPARVKYHPYSWGEIKFDVVLTYEGLVKKWNSYYDYYPNPTHGNHSTILTSDERLVSIEWLEEDEF